jgi:hypothetical protein
LHRKRGPPGAGGAWTGEVSRGVASDSLRSATDKGYRMDPTQRRVLELAKTLDGGCLT